MPRRIARIVIVLGTIAAAAPIQSAAAGGCHAADTTDAPTTRVVMQNNCFSPTIARVPAGAAVTWINKDAAGHTVTGANLSWGDMDELGAAKMVNVRFSRAGVYPYYCFIHPGMAGAVLVGKADGSDAAGIASGSRDVELVDTSSGNTGAVKVGTTRTASGASLWLALSIAVATGGLGFGIGRRRARRPEEA